METLEEYCYNILFQEFKIDLIVWKLIMVLLMIVAVGGLK